MDPRYLFSTPQKRWGFAVDTFHVMEKPCHVSQDLVHPAVVHYCHARHKSSVVKPWATRTISLRCCLFQSRPVPGLTSVNKLSSPGELSMVLKSRTCASLLCTVASVTHDALWLLNGSPHLISLSGFAVLWGNRFCIFFNIFFSVTFWSYKALFWSVDRKAVSYCLVVK